MSRTATVRPEPPRRDGEVVECAAEVRWPFRASLFFHGRQRQRLWIRVPVEAGPDPVAVGDAFLLATVFGAMRLCDRLHVHGPVSADLLAHLEALERLWHEREPDRYRPAALSADRTVAPAPAAGPSVLTFSGGLDSAYSLWKHAGPRRAPSLPPLSACVIVGGFDVPVEERDAFAAAARRAERMPASLGVPLLRAETNVRVVKQKWSHSVTAAIAAVLGLRRASHGRGLVGVGFTPEEARRWWPQDETDPPLVSTAAFPLVSDGWEADRFEKADALRDWPEALATLRVCFRPGSWTGNCGDCFKCWVAAFFLQIATGRPAPCFPRPVGLAEAEKMVACGDVNLDLRLGQILRHAKARGVAEPWVGAIDRALAGRAERGGAAGRSAPPESS